MTKPFDQSFFAGALLVGVAVVLAIAALRNPSLPVIGSGTGALIAVAIVGMAGCSVGGLSQAPVLGWGHPFIVLGSVLGVAALAIIAAGLFGWDALLRPVAQLAPGGVAEGASTAQIAIIALAAVIVLKWLIGVAFAASRALSVTPA